jgi:hypothetical protein
MADLFNQQISATYSGLLKTSSSGVLSASLSQISDGRGNTSPLYLSTDSIQFYGAYSFPNADGSANQVLKTDGAGVLTWENDANTGTVTSVALSVPTGLTVTGSPITTSGTITIGGTLGVANGGTGATTLTGILVGNGTSAISVVTDGTVGKVLSTNANGTYSFIDAATGDVSISGTPVANQIAIWTDATTIKGDATFTIDANHKITLYQPNSVPTDLSNYNIGGGNIATVTGLNNTGFGKDNLNALTSGFSNVAIGYESSENLTVGFRNVSVGYQSLFSAQGATDNTAVGEGALYANISGEENVAIGAYALRLTIDGYNTAVGQGAGSNNQQGEFNTYVGRSSGSGNASSDNNVAIGSSALTFFTGGNNTSIGMQSLLGVTNQSTGTGNTAIGYNSGSAMTTGSQNVIIGSFTGFRAAATGVTEYSIITSSNNIVLSDGDGNVRQSFDSNGDATFSGNIGVGGGTPSIFTTYSVASFGSLSTTNNGITIASAATGSGFIEFADDSSGGSRYSGYIQYNHNDDLLTFGTLGSPRLTISEGGAATFSGDVKIDTNGGDGALGGTLRLFSKNGHEDARNWALINTWSNYGDLTFRVGDAQGDDPLTNGSTKMVILSGGDAIFSGNVTTKALNSTTSGVGNLTAYIGNQITSASGSTGYGLAIESEATAATSYAMTIRNLAGSNTYFHVSTETGKVGNVGIGMAAPTYKLQLSTDSAAKPSTSTWTISSDSRVKENIRDYTTGLEAILKINPKWYDYNGKAGFEKIKDNIGVIAQDMIKVMPETIKIYKAKLNEEDEEDTELYNYDSHAVTFALINAIKEQQTIIEDLKARIETLEG